MNIQDELQALEPSAKLEFFVLDASSLGAGPAWRFFNHTRGDGGTVVWQGQAYTAIPIEFSGAELRGDGPRPRPKLTVGDVSGVLAAYVRAYADLAGARLVRRQTHARYLDAVNFPGGNAQADATVAYADELWLLDRVVSRDGTHVAWELVSPLDQEDVLLPGRQVRNALCGSGYRSPECGYTGGPVAMVDDTPTANPLLDECSRLVSGCKKRFGNTAELPIDFFPGAGTVRQM